MSTLEIRGNHITIYLVHWKSGFSLSDHQVVK